MHFCGKVEESQKCFYKCNHCNYECTFEASPSGSAGTQQSKRRESNQSYDPIVPPPIAMTLSHPGALCRVSERQTPLCCVLDKTLI